MIYNIFSVYYFTKCYPHLCERIYITYHNKKINHNIKSTHYNSKSQENDRDLYFLNNFQSTYNSFPNFKMFLKNRLSSCNSIR